MPARSEILLILGMALVTFGFIQRRLRVFPLITRQSGRNYDKRYIRQRRLDGTKTQRHPVSSGQ